MAFTAMLRAAVLVTTLRDMLPAVRRGVVLVITTAVRMLAVVFVAAVPVLSQLAPCHAAEPGHAGVIQVATAMQCVHGPFFGHWRRLVVGWSGLFCRAAGSVARVLARIGGVVLLQLGGTLLACGIGCTWAAGLSSWPGRPPGPAGHAPAPGPALCSRGSTCALYAYLVDAATYYGNLVLLRCYGYGRALASFGVPMRGDCAFAACFHRQPTAAAVPGPSAAYLRLRHAVAPNRRGLAAAAVILLASVALTPCLLGGGLTRAECGAITASLGQVPKRSHWQHGPERDGAGLVGRGRDSSQRRRPFDYAFASDSAACGWDFCISTCACAGASGSGTCMGARANLTTASLTSAPPAVGLGDDRPRWRLTGGVRDGSRGLWLRSSRLPGALVLLQPSARASLPTLLADALDLLATCACIANQAAAAAAEVEAVSAWCSWQPPRPLLDRVRTAGVGSRAPLAMPRESAHAVEQRFLMAQAQQRLAAGCAVQLAFISFALTPLLFAQLLLLSLQLTCEACCILLIACTILTAGVLCCMLCMLFVLCSLVGVVLRLVRWVRRGLLLSARELAVGSSRELTWLEVLGVTLLEVSAASTLTPGPLVRSLLAMVWSALGVVIILVGVLAIGLPR